MRGSSGVRLAREEGNEAQMLNGGGGCRKKVMEGLVQRASEEARAVAISCSMCQSRRGRGHIRAAGLDHSWGSG